MSNEMPRNQNFIELTFAKYVENISFFFFLKI